MLKLRVTVNGKVEREIDMDHDIIVGRKEPADIVVVDGQVSSRHARLRAQGDQVIVCDMGSTNGTRIDAGERLTPQVDVPLARGQKLLIGPAVIEIVIPAEVSESGFGHSEKTVLVGAGNMKDLLVQVARFRAAQPKLVIAAEQGCKVIDITEMEVVVGRDAASSQVAVSHQSVSSRHARFKFDSGRFCIEDLGSANGTFVEGNRVMGVTPLDTQSAITLGTVECLFVMKAPEAGGAGGSSDSYAEILCDHAARMGKVSAQKAREALADHRSSGRTLGEIFVSTGAFTPKEWSEVYRQRSLLGALRSNAGTGGGGSKVGLIIGVVIGVVGLLVALGYAFGMFGGKAR